MKDFTTDAIDFFKDLVVILVIVLFVRTFFIMPFQINGESMAESYYNKEFIIVDRLSYRNFPIFGNIRDITRGDVIVFEPGVNEERKYYIKRVIGLPGETLKIEDGKVFIKEVGARNFTQLDESAYLNEENNNHTTVGGSSEKMVYEIPENSYFVMGDNRNHSTDSRSCFQSCALRDNYITPDAVIGKVFLDLGYFSFSSFSFYQNELGITTYPRFFSSPATESY